MKIAKSKIHSQKPSPQRGEEKFLLPLGEKVRMRGKREKQEGMKNPLTLILSPEGRGERNKAHEIEVN